MTTMRKHTLYIAKKSLRKCADADVPHNGELQSCCIVPMEAGAAMRNSSQLYTPQRNATRKMEERNKAL
eukprot:CAMPEP_0183524914 /NCGR_PEP_ID=MMETSP0371-20130417/20255_1 /TAXON_ID=268820 /ORGANISM="Peridinium aciculiferum, Strain PAER-2" /LENGTH=68 /DNA_ID=CAMNT_0025724089 /DNA_START=83 /DNA_END=289 /DNA_ORIENTATION=+